MTFNFFVLKAQWSITIPTKLSTKTTELSHPTCAWHLTTWCYPFYSWYFTNPCEKLHVLLINLYFGAFCFHSAVSLLISFPGEVSLTPTS